MYNSLLAGHLPFLTAQLQISDIYYYILSANCSTCPFATSDTSITYHDVPSCGLCTLAVHTVVNDYTVKDLLSDPAYVSLNWTRSCVQIKSNYSETNIGEKY